MPILAWLAAHQAIAAALATYVALTAAGVDVVNKSLELKDHLQHERSAAPPSDPDAD